MLSLPSLYLVQAWALSVIPGVMTNVHIYFPLLRCTPTKTNLVWMDRCYCGTLPDQDTYHHFNYLAKSTRPPLNMSKHFLIG